MLTGNGGSAQVSLERPADFEAPVPASPPEEVARIMAKERKKKENAEQKMRQLKMQNVKPSQRKRKSELTHDMT